MKYISLEEALQAIKDSELGMEYDAVEAVPAFDLVECRDCKHYGMAKNECNGFCKMHDVQPFDPWDFCSYGERKDG